MKRPLINTLLTIMSDDALLGAYHETEAVMRDTLVAENADAWKSDDLDGLKAAILEQLRFRDSTFTLKTKD